MVLDVLYSASMVNFALILLVSSVFNSVVNYVSVDYMVEFYSKFDLLEDSS